MLLYPGDIVGPADGVPWGGHERGRIIEVWNRGGPGAAFASVLWLSPEDWHGLGDYPLSELRLLRRGHAKPAEEPDE